MNVLLKVQEWTNECITEYKDEQMNVLLKVQEWINECITKSTRVNKWMYY